MVGIAALLFALALGLHLRLDWVRKLEIVLLPGVGVALTVACVLAIADGESKPLLVVGLYWVKVVFAIKVFRSPRVRVAFATRDRPPLRELLAGLGEAAAGIGALILLGLLVTGVAWARYTLLPEGTRDDPLQMLGTAVGALLGGVLVFVAGVLIVARRQRRRQAPELVDAATRERIFALRDADEGLRAIRRVLVAEGIAPPGGGAWTPTRVKKVLLLRPLRPSANPEP
jgi:hypothetical protein